MTFHWGAGLGQRIKNDKVETRTNRNQKKKQKTLESKKNIHITKKAIIPEKAIKRQTLEDAGIYNMCVFDSYPITFSWETSGGRGSANKVPTFGEKRVLCSLTKKDLRYVNAR